MKPVRIHHEGGQSGPRAAGAMADWRVALGHGPENAQRDAIARARLSIAPAPPSTRPEDGLVIRLKPRPDPPGDLA